ncbi:MAG: hypothetical protein AUH13_19810 [Acidobacteria bacterium 13_2_20CM_58_27]|nr:MAG: hypothetical protein AUH13_19810 [Acidobacteria bacterium 13_2_20CM_58_27]
MTKANRARPRRKLQSAKQLRVCSHNNSGQAHGDCTDTNGEIESAVDEKNRELQEGRRMLASKQNRKCSPWTNWVRFA